MSRTDGGLRQLFRTHLPKVHWQSIEVPAIAKGVPDCNGCYAGVEFWIENKVTTGWTIGLRPEQVAWLTARDRHGGRTFIAVRRKVTAGKRKGKAVDQLWLLDARYAVRIKEINNLQHLQDCEPECLLHYPYDCGLGGGPYEGGPAKWLWSEVLRALSGKSFAPPPPWSRTGERS